MRPTNKRKKVLLIANTDWYLFNFRLTLALFLKEKGYEVIMVSPRGPYIDEFKRIGCRWIEWGLSRRISWPWKELRALRQVIKILRVEKPDVIHLHTLKALIHGSVASLFYDNAGLINSFAGRGYVYSSKNPIFVLLSHAVNRLILLIDRARTATWLFENQADLDYFKARKLITRGKTLLIESVGLNLDKFPPLPELTGKPTVLYAGRMLRSKGVGLLVEAVRLLKSQGFEFSCILAGEPDKGSFDSIQETDLQEWNKEGLVNWVGWQKETATWYQRANLVVFPTTYGEGVPTVLLEAAASGRAIVATDHPGCAAVVKDGKNGLLIPKDDVQALANAISRLLGDPGLRRHMGEVGRQIVEAKFSIDAINEITLSAY